MHRFVWDLPLFKETALYTNKNLLLIFMLLCILELLADSSQRKFDFAKLYTIIFMDNCCLVGIASSTLTVDNKFIMSQ